MADKQPIQERSKITFRSILEATTQILNRAGDATLTTRGIAERAGVSIGSLYQYFSNTDSVLSEVLRDRIKNDVREVWAVFEAGATLDLQPRFEAVFKRILETHLPLGRVRTALFQRAASLKMVGFARDEVETLTRKMFAELKRAGKLRSDLNDELTIYLLSRTVFGVTMSATIDHEKTKGLENDLARELARLLTGYVAPDRH